jgi:hypothetical protein
MYNSLQGLSCKWFIILDECKEFTLSTCFGSTVKIIIKQSKKKGCWCGSLKNEGLEQIKFGWVYVLDDDNILHPSFINLIWFYIDFYGPLKKQAFVFDQLLPDGTIRTANYDVIKMNHIDQAQYLVHHELIGNLRYDENLYQDDGLFIETLHYSNPEKFMVINETMCYYNKLRS